MGLLPFCRSRHAISSVPVHSWPGRHADERAGHGRQRRSSAQASAPIPPYVIQEGDRGIGVDLLRATLQAPEYDLHIHYLPLAPSRCWKAVSSMA